MLTLDFFTYASCVFTYAQPTRKMVTTNQEARELENHRKAKENQKKPVENPRELHEILRNPTKIYENQRKSDGNHRKPTVRVKPEAWRLEN